MGSDGIADGTGGGQRGASIVRASGWLTIIGLAVVIATGVWLLLYYRPTAEAWVDVTALNSVDRGVWVDRVHRVGAYLSAVALIVWTVAMALRHRMIGLAYGLIGIASAAVAFYSGTYLPWDQLALWSVTVGTNITGFTPVFDDDVRFLLIDGQRVDPGTLQRWLMAHLFFGSVVVVPLVLAARDGRLGRGRHRSS